MKKNSKATLLTLIYSFLTLSATITIGLYYKNAHNAHNNQDHSKSSINFNLNNNIESSKSLMPSHLKVFLESELTIEGVRTLGWDSKVDITLDDWAQAPNVTSIGQFVNNAPFQNNKVLKTIVFPSRITRINTNSFEGTTLSSIEFETGSRLSRIDNRAFSSITNLSKIIIPDSVTMIADNTFENSTSITDISMHIALKKNSTRPLYGFNQQQWHSILWRIDKFDGNILTKDIVRSLGWDKKTEIKLTDWSLAAPNVTEISSDATDGSLLGAAFNENKILISIEIPAKVTSINYATFLGTSSLTKVSFEANSKLNKIGNSAFKNSAINSIAIPPLVTLIDSASFEQTTSLKNVTFDPNSKLDKVSATTFKNSGISSITIPSSVTLIENSSFEQATSLTSIVFLPNSKLISIGSNAFKDTKITSLVLPVSIASIGTNAFSGITSLTSIEFPYKEQLLLLSNPRTPLFGLTQKQWNSIVWKNIPTSGVKINYIIAKEILKKDAIVSWEELGIFTGIQAESFSNTNLRSIRIEWRKGFIIDKNAFINTSSLIHIEMSDKYKNEVQNYGFTEEQLKNIIFIPSANIISKNSTIVVSVLASLLGVAVATAAIEYFLIVKYTREEKNIYEKGGDSDYFTADNIGNQYYEDDQYYQDQYYAQEDYIDKQENYNNFQENDKY